MNESEFATKVLKDKSFLLEMVKNIPDELLNQPNSEAGGQGQENRNMGEFYSSMFFPAAEAMGYSFNKDALEAEFTRQTDSLSGLAKAGFTFRFFRSLKKAGKGTKQP